MELHAIRDGETAVVWDGSDLPRGATHRVGSGPGATLYLDPKLCAGLLFQLEWLSGKPIVTELGEEELRGPAGDSGRFALENGDSFRAAGWRFCFVHGVAPELALTEELPDATPTRGADDVVRPGGVPLALKVREGRRYRIVEAVAGTVLGRHAVCHLPFDHPYVSNRHARLIDFEGGLAIEDLKSLGGTFVNGVPVRGAPTPLAPGNVITLTGGPNAPRIEVLARSDVGRARRDDPGAALIGADAVFLEQLALLERFTEGEGVIHLGGESGTGKELVARYAASLWRPGKPFVPVDCGAIPAELIERELFGSEKGAFTGAEQREGLVAAADGGVLFLDEIGEVAAAQQPAFLRLIQEREYRPVGAVAYRRADVRIVTATWRDLDAMAAANAFRLDLLKRLGLRRVKLPPLRERRSDIPLIAEHYLANRKARRRPMLDETALPPLFAYAWPGNVRELCEVLDVAALRTDGSLISAETLIAVLRDLAGSYTGQKPSSGGLPASLEAYERETYAAAIAAAGGDWKAARVACAFQKSERSFRRRLKHLGLL